MNITGKFCTLAFFVVLCLCSGCFLVEDLNPDPPCINNLSVTNPFDVDSAWFSVICDDSVLLSNKDGILIGFNDTMYYHNEGSNYVFSYDVETDDPIWHGKEEIQCRLDMDVFCNSEKYPFIEYEWSFHQRNRQLLRFSHLVDGVGKKISKKNDVCGSGRYAVDIWTPRDRHCADDL
jgi:hypothetical protein